MIACHAAVCGDVPAGTYSVLGSASEVEGRGDSGVGLLLLCQLDGHGHLAQVDGVLSGFGLPLLLHCREDKTLQFITKYRFRSNLFCMAVLLGWRLTSMFVECNTVTGDVGWAS